MQKLLLKRRRSCVSKQHVFLVSLVRLESYCSRHFSLYSLQSPWRRLSQPCNHGLIWKPQQPQQMPWTLNQHHPKGSETNYSRTLTSAIITMQIFGIHMLNATPMRASGKLQCFFKSIGLKHPTEKTLGLTKLATISLAKMDVFFERLLSPYHH